MNLFDILDLLEKTEEGSHVDAPCVSSEDMKLISKYSSAIQDNQASRTRRNQPRRSAPLKDKQCPELKRASYSTASLSDESLSDDSSIDKLEDEPCSRPLQVQDKANDPFLYYSSDKRRMEFLLGRELPEMPLEEPVKRKTRMSFELDPLHDMLNSFPDLFDDMDQEDLDDSLLDLLDDLWRGLSSRWEIG